MPAAKNSAAPAVASCIVLVRSYEGAPDLVSYFGDDAADACSCARAHTEDGDGEYQYAVKRVHGARAAEIRALAVGGATGRQLLAVYLRAA